MADVHASQDRLARAYATRETEPASRLDRVRLRFLAKLPERRREIFERAEEIHHYGLRKDATAAICQHAHKIAGVAATLGFPGPGNAAMAVDTSASGPVTRDALLEQVDVLLDEIDRISTAAF